MPAGKYNVQATIENITRRIVDNFDPVRVILFGSHARGDADRYSDIDILVIMENGVDKINTEISIRKKVKDLPGGKDILVATTNDVEQRGNVCGYALYYAIREGVVTYER